MGSCTRQADRSDRGSAPGGVQNPGGSSRPKQAPRQLRESQIVAASAAVDLPTLKPHLYAKQALETTWGSIVKQYQEDESFKSNYVKEIRRLLGDDLDRIANYVNECFPRLRSKYEIRAAELTYIELGIKVSGNRPTPDFLAKVELVANRIRLAFYIWTWLKRWVFEATSGPFIA